MKYGMLERGWNAPKNQPWICPPSQLCYVWKHTTSLPVSSEAKMGLKRFLTHRVGEKIRWENTSKKLSMMFSWPSMILNAFLEPSEREIFFNFETTSLVPANYHP